MGARAWVRQTANEPVRNLIRLLEKFSGAANFERGRKGAFELTSLIRKRNQTNQLQAKLLTSGPGSRRFKYSLPDQTFQAVKAC
jgi:hypothetical protein